MENRKSYILKIISIKTYENMQTQYNTTTKIYKMTYGKKEFNNRGH